MVVSVDEMLLRQGGCRLGEEVARLLGRWQEDRCNLVRMVINCAMAKNTYVGDKQMLTGQAKFDQETIYEYRKQ